MSRWGNDERNPALQEVSKLKAAAESRDQRIAELTVALQDLYDWGPGENATPAAKESWEEAYKTLLNARA